MKYVVISPGNFIPPGIFRRFPAIQAEYKAVVSSSPLTTVLSDSISEAAIKEVKDMVIHSFVKIQENNCVFIAQVEAYYHHK